jgi:molybdate transport system substrate-binding protein
VSWYVAAVFLALSLLPRFAAADELTLVAPGGMRCPLDRLLPRFEQQTGHKVKPTIGAGGATHQQVVNGEPFDVPIVQPPYADVLKSGNVVAGTETPLASVAVIVAIRKGEPKPDISTPDAVRRLLLRAKAISYPDGAGGRGGAAGVSFDETQKKLGIFEQVQPKVRRTPGVSLMELLARGDIDVAVTFASEVSDPRIEIVGPLPKEISTPTALVGFVSSHTGSPEAARSLLSYLASQDAKVAYRACAMEPSPARK